MKSYEEITNNLLERRDRYVAEQNRKRKRVMGVVTPICGFCLVALVGLGVWQSGLFATMPPDQTIGDAIHPGIDDTVDESEGQSSDHFTANNKIVIHPIDGLSDNRMNISLMINDFVEMTRDEMIDYYGIDYIPEVPADIKPWEDDRSGIYKRGGGIGEVYWDADILNYSNEDFTRSVWLEVQKGRQVFVDFICFKGTEEKSVINNTEVLIGQTEDGHYYAQFMYQSVGFLLCAEGVSEDEFVSIIVSLVS